MRVLRCAQEIEHDIESTPDPAVAQLLTRHTQFTREYEGEESLTVLMVEPGDTLETVDSALHHQLLANVAVRADVACTDRSWFERWLERADDSDLDHAICSQGKPAAHDVRAALL